MINLDIGARLLQLRNEFLGRIVFTSSFGIEDQLITHHIATQKLDIEIVTLDTGRLFDETHKLWQETEEKYDITIKGFFPNADDISKWVRANGTNGFYNSLDARKKCCAIRKIEPLNRALINAQVWITGLRSDASDARAQIGIFEDDARGIKKFNPLFDQSRDAIVEQVLKLEIPYNELHDKGFLSIGCAPCTRATAIGEDERAGRWWWENAQSGKKECGLHIGDDGQLFRANAATDKV
jgi:phosphoadenosine phosphosulfate reductase